MKEEFKIFVIAMATGSAFYGANVLAANDKTASPAASVEIMTKDCSSQKNGTQLDCSDKKDRHADLPVANAGNDSIMLKNYGCPGSMNYLNSGLSKNAVSYQWKIIYSSVPMELSSTGSDLIKTGKLMEGKAVFANEVYGLQCPKVPYQKEAIFKLTVTNKDGKKSSSQVRMTFIPTTANIKGNRVIFQGKPLNLSVESNITGDVKYQWEIYPKNQNKPLVQRVSKKSEFFFDTKDMPEGEYELYADVSRGTGKHFVSVTKIERLTILQN